MSLTALKSSEIKQEKRRLVAALLDFLERHRHEFLELLAWLARPVSSSCSARKRIASFSAESCRCRYLKPAMKEKRGNDGDAAAGQPFARERAR